MHVRKAKIEDSASLARIQVDSYWTSFAGILPQSYLDGFTYVEQEQDWRDWFSSGSRDILYVAETGKGEVAGYALGRHGPTAVADYDSELVALHIRRGHHRQGIGRRLVAAAAGWLGQQGCTSLMLWVLADNPATGFYGRLGGELLGSRIITLGRGDITAVEVAYGWPCIESLCQEGSLGIERE
jgi:GNAT superfamily N-acetyltransferase